MMQVTKVWWDGEKLMAEPIDPTTIYQEPAQQEPVTWAISYDGKTPYAIWPDGDGALLDLEIKRQGGTASKMPLYASPQPAQQGPVAVELVGVEDAIKEGDGFWKSCTGCYETNEGHPPTGAFFSSVFKCHMGHGCSECGGLGAIWDDTDYEAMADHMRRDDAAPQPAQQEPVAGVVLREGLPTLLQDRNIKSTDQRLYTSPPAQRKPLTDERMFEMAEIAWRHGWASCRDADYVGEEAEDERWGMVGAEVVQDIADLGIKGDA